MSNKPKEWFAVKRTIHSNNYHFYSPNEKNRSIIEAIAPEGGNLEVVELIDKKYYEALQKRYEKLRSLTEYFALIAKHGSTCYWLEHEDKWNCKCGLSAKLEQLR